MTIDVCIRYYIKSWGSGKWTSVQELLERDKPLAYKVYGLIRELVQEMIRRILCISVLNVFVIRDPSAAIQASIWPVLVAADVALHGNIDLCPPAAFAAAVLSPPVLSCTSLALT